MGKFLNDNFSPIKKQPVVTPTPQPLLEGLAELKSSIEEFQRIQSELILNGDVVSEIKDKQESILRQFKALEFLTAKTVGSIAKEVKKIKVLLWLGSSLLALNVAYAVFRLVAE